MANYFHSENILNGTQHFILSRKTKLPFDLVTSLVILRFAETEEQCGLCFTFK